MLIIANSADTRAQYQLPAIKSFFEGESIQDAHDYHVDIRTAVWLQIGYGGSIPYNVLFDRDGYARMAENFVYTWDDVVAQLCGT